MPRVHYTYSMFVDKIQPKGFLPHAKAAHACYYYAQLAHKNLLKAERGAIFEDESDPIVRLKDIAMSVATIYGLTSPAEFFNYMRNVRMQVTVAENGKWDKRVEDPFNYNRRNIAKEYNHADGQDS